MTLQPLLHANLAVKVHVATIVPAFLIGTWQIFFSTKGALLHRLFGSIYLVLMTITATAAFFIRNPYDSNPFSLQGLSWIHLFIPLTFFGLVSTLFALYTHNTRGHRGSMLGLYVGGILIAGALAFTPGRIMHAVVFGS